MTLNVALIQMDIAYGNPQVNGEKVKTKVGQAATNEADVVVLPELWTTGYDLQRLDTIADTEGRDSLDLLADLAKAYNVHVVGGSIANQSEKQPLEVKNTMLVVNAAGEKVKAYSKAHLFRLMDEEKYLVEGNENGWFSLAGVPSAGLICYDIRFPEWVRMHALGEMKVLYVVAEWPKPRIDHWRALLISRAIENQCYVVACNRVGADPNNTFGGHSIVVGPWGEILAEAGEEETILYSEIDIDQVDKVRTTIPIFSDRRSELY
ncbi:Predicted amidohydrolase [Salinibacillus kushneri]|uniref:Predicted amidohydrolase n=1 Tax=Salinibacillus kushneri TaxID=237682 RepID=A0A1H9ZEU9_9BACI|nr:carbon-nitrogen family hydrolase [Salinibacillus kushneri]SES80112.1 Predicted amidohydrolase [Salinibacillus kushneri]